jgi:hypothetical protein
MVEREPATGVQFLNWEFPATVKSRAGNLPNEIVPPTMAGALHGSQPEKGIDSRALLHARETKDRSFFASPSDSHYFRQATALIMGWVSNSGPVRDRGTETTYLVKDGSAMTRVPECHHATG